MSLYDFTEAELVPDEARIFSEQAASLKFISTKYNRENQNHVLVVKWLVTGAGRIDFANSLYLYPLHHLRPFYLISGDDLNLTLTFPDDEVHLETWRQYFKPVESEAITFTHGIIKCRVCFNLITRCDDGCRVTLFEECENCHFV